MDVLSDNIMLNLNLFCTFVHIWQTASPAGIWSNFRSIYTLKNILNKTEIYSYCSTAFTSNTSINPALIISFLRWSRNSRSSALESMALMSWRHPPWKQEYTVKMSRKKFFQLTSYWNKNITFYKRICQVGISLIHVNDLDIWACIYTYLHPDLVLLLFALTLILLRWRIWWGPNTASRWQMAFILAFKGLTPLANFHHFLICTLIISVQCPLADCILLC